MCKSTNKKTLRDRGSNNDIVTVYKPREKSPKTPKHENREIRSREQAEEQNSSDI